MKKLHKTECDMCGSKNSELMYFPEFSMAICNARNACFKRQQDKEKQ